MERSLLFKATVQSRSASMGGMVAVPKAENRQEIVVKPGVPGIHIGPRSWVRFRRNDGTRTGWCEAGALWVSGQAVVVPGPEGLRWQDIQAIEVNELDLARSAGGIVVGTGLVIAEILIGVARGALDEVSTEVLQRPPDDPSVTTP